MKKRKPKTAGLSYEYKFWGDGFRQIVGLDEAGRGAWAGPVSAGAVCLPPPGEELLDTLAGVRDSKTMTPRQRGLLVGRIKETAVAWGVGSASNVEIDQLGIVPATKLAMSRALENMMQQFPSVKPDCLFLDSMKWDDAPIQCRREHIVKGDSHSLTIAAASVLAKTWRDDCMRELDKQLPNYEFAAHKGYGTAKHQLALKSLGVSVAHRTYYRPIRDLLGARG